MLDDRLGGLGRDVLALAHWPPWSLFHSDHLTPGMTDERVAWMAMSLWITQPFIGLAFPLSITLDVPRERAW